MINKVKTTYTTETISDGSYILKIDKKEKQVISVTLIDASESKHKELWVISNKENELGNFLYLVKRYFYELDEII